MPPALVEVSRTETGGGLGPPPRESDHRGDHSGRLLPRNGFRRSPSGRIQPRSPPSRECLSHSPARLAFMPYRFRRFSVREGPSVGNIPPSSRVQRRKFQGVPFHGEARRRGECVFLNVFTPLRETTKISVSGSLEGSPLGPPRATLVSTESPTTNIPRGEHAFPVLRQPRSASFAAIRRVAMMVVLATLSGAVRTRSRRPAGFRPIGRGWCSIRWADG